MRTVVVELHGASCCNWDEVGVLQPNRAIVVFDARRGVEKVTAVTLSSCRILILDIIGCLRKGSAGKIEVRTCRISAHCSTLQPSSDWRGSLLCVTNYTTLCGIKVFPERRNYIIWSMRGWETNVGPVGRLLSGVEPRYNHSSQYRTGYSSDHKN